MKRALVVIVLLVMLAWWRWPDVSLPAFGSRHPGSASITPDDEDDPVEDTSEPSPPPKPKPPSSERRTLVPTYDPWAGPPPFDPNAPRLPDVPEESQTGRHANGRKVRGALRELQSALADCYAAQTPTPHEPLSVMMFFEHDAADGGTTETVELRDAKGEPLPAALDACVKDLVTKTTLSTVDEAQSFRAWMTVPPPAN